jgi:hypothetical protein
MTVENAEEVPAEARGGGGGGGDQGEGGGEEEGDEGKRISHV